MKFCCADKKLFFIGGLCISQKSRSFSQPKHCLFEQAILLSSNDANFRNRHRKFAPSHNLLSTKERRCSFYLRSKSLRCNAGTSHRFKAFSPPFCAKNRFRLVSSENFAEIFFDRALNRPRSPEGRNPLACFLVLFARRKKNKTVPFREFRGFANLESARKHDNFAQAQLNPLPLRGFFRRLRRPFSVAAATILAASRHLSGG